MSTAIFVCSPATGRVRMTLAEHAKKVKEQNGLTIAAIVRNSNGSLSRSYINKIFNSEIKNPSDERMETLAAAMNAPVDEFKRAARGDPSPEIWTAREVVKAMESIIANPALSDVVKVLLQMEEPDLEKCARYLRRYKRKL
jgi:transcriptional regulator with XRE-family HTH domain